MRTGKTLAAIAGTDDGDRLIVCPNSVKGVWLNDLKAWGQEAYIWGSSPFPAARPRNVIVNYETVWRNWLLAGLWDSVIFDESLRLQNPRTKLWSAIADNLHILRQAKRIICLSGTPCPEGFHQLITQAIVSSGSYCGETDPWKALRTFFTYDEASFKWKINPGHKQFAKAQLAAMGESMTQSQAGILTRKLYRTIQVPYGSQEATLWAGVDKTLPAATLGLYAQSCASGRPIEGEIEQSAKLDAVAEYVIDLLDRGEQCVVLTHFTSSLAYLHGKLLPRMVKCIHGGDEGAAYRTGVIAEFNSGKVACIIANVATVKVGLNLSKASAIIFAENSFSGETRIQAEERATVMGKESVEIVDFVTVGDGILGEIDQHVLTCVRAKKDFNSKMLNFSKEKK